MFFKDIAEWSKRKVFLMDVLFSAIYIVFMIIIPIIIIAVNYGAGETVEKSKLLTSWSLVLILIVAVVGIFSLSKLARKLPDETYKQRTIKYTVELVQSLILPVLAFVMLHQFKVNFDLAYKVLSWCIVSFICGILIDGLVLKYIDKELSFNKEIDHKAEIEKRAHRMH